MASDSGAGPASAFSKAELIQLFPTCVWVHEVKDAAALNARLLPIIAQLERDNPLSDAPANAWQSSDDLHVRPEFAELSRLAIGAARNVFGFLKCRFDEIYLTSLWANINRTGHAHHDHTHPNNFLSGVYYAKAPKGCGGIVFADPRPQASVLAPAIEQTTPFTANIHRIEPQEGRMVLFQSWLQHSVEANHSDDERVSIAFNVMLHGPIGADKARARV